MTVERLKYGEGINFIATSRVERELRIDPCAKEPEFVEWVESLEPGALYDIGANTGSHSLVAAANGHEVHAFEPPGPNHDRLLQNLDLNSELNVRPHPVLLGDKQVTQTFSYSSLEPGSACHSLGLEGVKTELLEMRTLDSYVAGNSLPWPDYIKLDVDGSELLVLKGGYVCFGKMGECKSVLMEVDDELKESEQAIRLLSIYGFKVTSKHRHHNGSVSNWRFDK